MDTIRGRFFNQISHRQIYLDTGYLGDSIYSIYKSVKPNLIRTPNPNSSARYGGDIGVA